MHCLTLNVVYADYERIVNIKTGWADSSRRMWHFPDDVAFKKMRSNITKRIFFFRVISNTSGNNSINFNCLTGWEDTPVVNIMLS